MIETEFILDGLEYSLLLPERYTWNQLAKREFIFEDGWVVPKRSQLIELFDREPKSKDDSNVWSSSANSFFSVYAWCINFSNGYSYSNFRTKSFDVRLVRDIKHGN